MTDVERARRAYDETRAAQQEARELSSRAS